MIFNRPLLVGLGAILGVLTSTPVNAAELGDDCKDIIYAGETIKQKDHFIICVLSENKFLAAWDDKNKQVTSITFDSDSASWSKIIKDADTPEGPRKVIETSFTIEGTKSKFVLTSLAMGLDNNTLKSTFKFNMADDPEEILTIDPYTVINGIGDRLTEKYAIAGNTFFIKGDL